MPELTHDVVTQLTTRIAELEAALRSVLNQPETAEAYDSMMQQITDALAGVNTPTPAERMPVAWRVEDVPGHVLYIADKGLLRGLENCPTTPLYSEMPAKAV